MAKRILHAIKLNEISAVDKPAQEGARMVLIKRASLAEGDVGDEDIEKGTEMSDEDKKKFADLEKSVADLTKTVTDVTKERDTLKSENETNKILASFDGDTMEYYKKLKADEQAGFLKLSDTLRKAAVANYKANDEEIQVEGETIRKSVVGAAMFNVLKAQSKRIKDSEEAIVKANARTQDAELRKRVVEDFNHLPGTVEERVEMLKGIEAISDAKAKATALATLKAAEATGKLAFKRIGAGGGSEEDKSAESQLDKLAKDLQKSTKGLTFAKAYDQVMREHPELYQQSLDEKRVSN